MNIIFIRGTKLRMKRNISIQQFCFQAMLAWSLLAVILCLFNTVNAACDNCEGPLGPYCCKTSFRGTCCEYPIDREDGAERFSPLGKHTWLTDEDIKLEKSKHSDRHVHDHEHDHV